MKNVALENNVSKVVVKLFLVVGGGVILGPYIDMILLEN